MDHAQLRSAAAGYPYLRGLLSVPVGLLLVLAALGNWESGPLRNSAGPQPQRPPVWRS
jgi:hypothetical protein